MGTGARIKELLEKDGKSVAWLARETGIPATTLRSAISKDRNNISISTMNKIAQALGVTVKSLTDGATSIGDAATTDIVDYESDYIFRLFDQVGYDVAPIKLKDNSIEYVVYGNDKKMFFSSKELHELIRGAKDAAAQYVRDALEKKE